MVCAEGSLDAAYNASASTQEEEQSYLTCQDMVNACYAWTVVLKNWPLLSC